LLVGRQVQGREDLVGRRVNGILAPFLVEELLQLVKVRLVEFVADDALPRSRKFRQHDRDPRSLWGQVCNLSIQGQVTNLSPQAQSTLLPTTAASLRRSSISAAYWFGSSACGPSDSAFSGQLWTSI